MAPSDSTDKLRLLAPLSGGIVPLEKVPDPVFAQRIVGDGVSIDPTSATLLAPCAGEVIHAHSSGHALTLRSEHGLEVLIHIGVDTVQLKGDGFSLKVRSGDKVAAGQTLAEFDADKVGRRCKSLLTQLLVTNLERVSSISHPAGRVKAGVDAALEVSLKGAAASAEAAEAGSHASSDALLVSNPAGLHARPASVLAHQAKRFRCAVHLRHGDNSANAKSLVAIMNLNIKQGDKVVIIAQGHDARDAVSSLSILVSEGLGARHEESPAEKAIGGICASPGLAVGKACQFHRVEAEVGETAGDPIAEFTRLASAIERAKAELESFKNRFASEGDPSKASIFEAHRELLDDPELLGVAEASVAKGISAAAAWHCAYQDHAGRLSRINNELLAARAADIKDVGMRVLRLLTGAPAKAREFPAESILLAEDLSPSDAASLDRSRVLGVCTVGGGATSHVAILCRSLAIPALAAADPRLLAVPDGAPLILDADRGFLLAAPTPAEIQAAGRKLEGALKRKASDIAAAREEARTRDGRRIRVEANVGGVSDAAEAARIGAEGVGLCRSEFLFLDRDSAPEEEQQVQAYGALAKEFPGRPVVVRVLDVGGDKRLPFLQMAKEENPFLGERGIRLLLKRPDLLRTQLRALLRASQSGASLKVLFPMIADPSEFQAAKAILDEEAHRLGRAPLPAGVMIEVPSAALMSARLAREADFFSLGTNDLTQYTLAMDRGNPKVASRVDALHPAVLQMMQHAVEGALAHGKPVGVCGGAAGDLQAVPLLIGLGVSELSVSPPAVPAVKAAVRRLDYEACRELSRKALAAASAAEVRSILSPAEAA
jgi:phosphocarrier protein FPr